MAILFRADSRPPEEIFKIGFTPKVSGGIQVQKGGQMIGGVSTSTELAVSVNYAACYEGWVYTVWLSSGGVDIVEYLLKQAIATAKPGMDANNNGGLSNALTQMEIACNALPATAIMAARRAHMVGTTPELYGLIDINLDCTLDSATQSLGLAPLA
jgi:hypothetical protein